MYQISGGLEENSNEILENRFDYYEMVIRDNSEKLNTIYERIYTEFKSLLDFDSIKITLLDI